jgi:hypothetical protein
MHNPNQIIAGVADAQDVASAVNGAATVTLAAPGARLRWLVLSTTISMNGDPAAAVSFTIVSGGATTLERIEFPAAACAPYNSRGIYKGGVNEAVVLSLPALGASIRGTVSVRAIKVPASGV